MEQITKLAETGILGLLLAIALVAIYSLYVENKRLQELRVQDAISRNDKVIEPIQSLQRTLELILFLIKEDDHFLHEKNPPDGQNKITS